ncbi:MAG: peptidoglycan DD-metalloendopeptidase family protein [Defluviitaleaceae bacterium]|nr:peptidoglycan DD-metalloendopeptidase family protein [Defluviitaleaceae bacterium]
MKKIIALFIVLLVIPILPVFASPATRERHSQLQQQLSQAAQSVREQQNLLAGTRHEMSQIVMEMQELDQQIMDAASALESIEFSLRDTEIRIADAEDELNVARDEHDLQFELLRTRVRVIHEEGSIGFLDVLFQAESIVDFFMRWEYIRAIAEFDHTLLDRLQQAEQDIQNHLEDLVRWRNMVEDLQFQYNLTMDDLEFMYGEREAWFENLSENEEVMAELLEIYLHEQRMAESAFGAIQAQLQSEENAMRRQANAQAHSARLATLNNHYGQFQWPIPTHSRISSPFGMRHHPILRQQRHHSGIDVGAPTGTRLIASADGYVRFAGWSGGYGNTVIIDHYGGYSTLYAHNSRNRVVTGQRVYRGDHIADVGSTGMSTGPHLHFEIRINNRAVDPMGYFPR